MTNRTGRAAAQRHASATRLLAETQTGEAGRLIAAGGLVAFPTETVYGLGADATESAAVARLYAAKGRPSFNPLITHVLSLGDAETLGRFDDAARLLASAFWPGPLTIVVPVADGCAVCELARAGLSSLALRVPDHPLARAALAAAERPVVAPSANRSGRVSPTTAAHVLEDLDGRIDAVVDGGATRVGLESTIVACLDGEPRLLRPGALTQEVIETVLGRRLLDAAPDAEGPLAPGRLASHYAPGAAVRLDATEVRDGEAFLGFGPDQGLRDQAAAYENLSSAGDLVEAAARLFACLRTLDATGVAAIAVAPIPSGGLGDAIRDRLEKAAAPRK